MTRLLSVLLILLKVTLVCTAVVEVAEQNSLSGEKDVDRERVTLTELDDDNLLLLNVAVKSRLVEMISDELKRTEASRDTMSSLVKVCLKNVTAVEKVCRHCVQELCTKRMSECNLDVPSLAEMVSLEESPIAIPGVQFLRPPATVQHEMEGFAQNAIPDIMHGVPNNLLAQGRGLIRPTETTVLQLQGRIQQVGGVPHNIPNNAPVSQVSSGLGANIDTFVNNADKTITAAEQMALRIRQGAGILQGLETNAQYMMSRLPAVMNRMGVQLRQATSVVDSVMGMAMKRFFSVLSGQSNPGASSRPAPQIGGPPGFVGTALMGRVEQPLPIPVPKTLGDILGLSRGKRSLDASCSDLTIHPTKACMVYETQCESCPPQSDLMKHVCGQEAVEAVTAIRHLDEKAKRFLDGYKQYIQHEGIVLKVEMESNKPNMKPENSLGYHITVKVAGKSIRFLVQETFDQKNLASEGKKISAKVWDLLLRHGAFGGQLKPELQMEPGLDAELMETVNGEFAHLNMAPSSDRSASRAVTTGLWSSILPFMYMGIRALR